MFINFSLHMKQQIEQHLQFLHLYNFLLFLINLKLIYSKYLLPSKIWNWYILNDFVCILNICYLLHQVDQFQCVIPIINTLFNEFTPSIIDNNWFTTVSCKPLPPALLLPRFLHIASISSNIIICNELSSPFSFCSNIASSDCPTYLLIFPDH